MASHYHPSLIFLGKAGRPYLNVELIRSAGKAGAYTNKPLAWAPHFVLASNLAGSDWQENALAYYPVETNTTVKSFEIWSLVQASS